MSYQKFASFSKLEEERTATFFYNDPLLLITPTVARNERLGFIVRRDKFPFHSTSKSGCDVITRVIPSIEAYKQFCDAVWAFCWLYTCNRLSVERDIYNYWVVFPLWVMDIVDNCPGRRI